MAKHCMEISNAGKRRSNMMAKSETDIHSFPPKVFVNLGSRKMPAENENRKSVESKSELASLEYRERMGP